MAASGRGHYKIFLGMAAGVGKTYRMLQEGRAEQADGPRRRDRLPRAARTRRDRRAGRGPRAAAAPRGRVPRHRRSRRWTCPAIFQRAPELCLIDELAHTNAPGRRARQALRGHRGRARRRHRRVLHRQRPAPGEPQRPGRRADRRARARDVPRPGARRRRRGRAGGPHARGADRSGCARARSTRPSACPPRSTTSSGSRTCPRCARSRCARWPRRSRRSGCARRRGARHARGAAGRRGPAGGGRAGAGAGHARAPRSQRLVRRAWRSAQRLGAELDLLYVRPPGRRRAARSASGWRRCAGLARCSASR